MNKKRLLFVDIFLVAFFVFLDQLSKALVVSKLKGQEPFVLIENVFELHYLENRGAAFGMLQNAKWFFLIAAFVLLIVIGYVLVKVPDQKQYFPWHFFAILLAAGGIGNMIDRITQDFVTDFLYFKLIDFPIFNVADIYVTVGTFLLVFYVIFFCKEEDLTFLTHQKNK